MFRRVLSILLLCTFVLTLFAACGTSSGGDVSIATDQGSYSTNEAIKVTITNNLQKPIYTHDGQAGCSIVSLSVQQGDNWTDAGPKAAPCTQNRPPALVKIDAGKSYTATIGGSSQIPLQPGNYRFVLAYSTSSSGVAAQDTQRLTANSASISVTQNSQNAPPKHF